MAQICDYFDTLADEYRWELVIVNDGSSDETGLLANEFALGRPNVKVLHHRRNFGLGQAFQYGLTSCTGDYVVVLDMDLSYEPKHVAHLLAAIRTSGSKIVAASPYMKGGQLSAVPWPRRTLSIWAKPILVARGSRPHVDADRDGEGLRCQISEASQHPLDRDGSQSRNSLYKECCLTPRSMRYLHTWTGRRNRPKRAAENLASRSFARFCQYCCPVSFFVR